MCPSEGSTDSRCRACPGEGFGRVPGASTRIYDVVLRFKGFKVFFRVSKANIQTRVNSEHLGKTRVGRNILSPWKHLLIESLGHGERFGTRVELGKL
ncbi:hypothetical protein QL285_061944 [Trifolium repens]|nr:hypothetical protein QL285_061944 [Trifolium repens]